VSRFAAGSHDRGRRQLNALHAVLAAGIGGEHRWQPAVAVRIDHEVQLPFGKVRQLGRGEGEQVGGERARLPEEVAAVDDFAAFGEEQRVVADTVQVVGHRVPGVPDRSSCRTQ